MSSIAIGDVHGNAAGLRDLLDQLRPEVTDADTVVFLGDYIDRGPDSKGCVDEILAFKPPESQQRRFSELLEKNRRVRLTEEEEDELRQFEQGELLMQLVKARLRSRRKRAS